MKETLLTPSNARKLLKQLRSLAAEGPVRITSIGAGRPVNLVGRLSCRIEQMSYDGKCITCVLHGAAFLAHLPITRRTASQKKKFKAYYRVQEGAIFFRTTLEVGDETPIVEYRKLELAE